jgi:hypothetical protein
MDLERLKTEIAQARDDRGRIEGGMNGVAGAGMIERKGEQARPSPTRAGVSSRRSVSERDDDVGGFVIGYSAGTAASRSRIE